MSCLARPKDALLFLALPATERGPARALLFTRAPEGRPSRGSKNKPWNHRKRDETAAVADSRLWRSFPRLSAKRCATAPARRGGGHASRFGARVAL